MTTRRSFLKMTMAAAAAAGLPWHLYMKKAYGAEFVTGLSDPLAQPKFANLVPDAMASNFIYRPKGGKKMSRITVGMGPSVQQTGLIDPLTGAPLSTPVWGYGDDRFVSWPGRTFEATSGQPLTVTWENRLGLSQLPIATFASMIAAGGTPFAYSPLDTSLHWAYSLKGMSSSNGVDYTKYDVKKDGFPVVPHLHGGHTRAGFDGNPEYFFGPGQAIQGPRYTTNEYVYDNDQPAGTLWYHDHALGITRLNVYAGLAGFYILRDADDTGLPNNPLSLPAANGYETALAIQDRMFTATGELFYPAYPGDPFYDDFINGEGADLSSFSEGGATGLAEFFGDHMLVNGVIWPKMDVEPRNYRLRLLNGCDSRFMVIRFRKAASATATDLTDAGSPIPFTVVGSDQGLSSTTAVTDTLVFEPGSRYDIVFDFKSVLPGDRIIMENIGSDTPFGFDYGDGVDPADLFPDRQTDRIMAFDVVLPFNAKNADVSPTSAGLAAYAQARSKNRAFKAVYGDNGTDRTRKVALFEGTDEFGRLQPLLGTAEPATDYNGDPINWPDTTAYSNVGLVGQMEGAIAWHSPTTENPKLGDTEVWEVFNVTGDSHPVHLHLVHFEVLGRKMIKWDSNADADGFIPLGSAPAGDGTYLEPQAVVQHNGTVGNGFRVKNATYETGGYLASEPEYVDANLPKDMVTARPGEVTFIKATFDKPGRYVWHCHILSHEDHEMMRVLHVGSGA